MEQNIWNELNAVFRDVMDNPDIAVGPGTTAKEIPEWDSITHVLLIAAVEKKFGVRFTAAEIQSFQNVGDLAESILKARV
jgi:acyl carrier protein